MNSDLSLHSPNLLLLSLPQCGRDSQKQCSCLSPIQSRSSSQGIFKNSLTLCSCFLLWESHASAKRQQLGTTLNGTTLRSHSLLVHHPPRVHGLLSILLVSASFLLKAFTCSPFWETLHLKLFHGWPPPQGRFQLEHSNYFMKCPPPPLCLSLAPPPRPLPPHPAHVTICPKRV